MSVQSPSNLVDLTQRLEAQRQQHAESAKAIAGTLEAISSLLSALLGGSRGASSQAGSKPAGSMTTPKPAPSLAAKPQRLPAKGSRAAKLGMTGEQSVLAFVRNKGNPTSAEIQAHWKSEGRGSSADNVLSKLFKEKKLIRTPNKQGRGSRYTLP